MSQPLIPITRQHAMVFALFLVLYETLTYIANDMIMPGMIHVVAAFHAPESAIASSLTAYVLGGASLQFFLGPLSDYYGRRPVMLVGVCLFLLFSLLIACCQSMTQFLVMRFFQGMGLCFISVIGYATIQEIFAEMDAIRLIAIMANISILAPLLGPLCGAAFMNYFSWRLIFITISTLSLLAWWGLWRYMPESVGAVKCNGEIIPRTPLALRTVARNYWRLLTNKTFVFATLAYGLIGLPCIAWIALSPVILVKAAHCSLFEYGVWQIPLFGSSIVGNVVLRRVSYENALHKIIFIGATIAIASIFVIWLGSYCGGDSFVWLMPGLIMYFFALGMVVAPLDRFILFVTPVSKGTTSALISLMAMLLLAPGVEIMNRLYQTHNNHMFANFCVGTGLAFLGCLSAAFYYYMRRSIEPNTTVTTQAI